MRLAYYAGASTAAAAACLLKAFHQRPNFYSATVYLSQSNACLLILTNLLLITTCSFIYGLQRVLYGPLRPIEIEQLSEKAWYAVLDTLLAMPSFREDVGGWLLVMFVLLLAGKVWIWIGEGRVDVLEQQPPANPRLFHTRLATSLVVSVLFDIFMLDFCVETIIADPKPGMMMIFTFEFAILSIFSIFTLSRYLLSLFEAAVVKNQTMQAIEVRKSEIRGERAAARQNETEDGRPTPASPPDDEPIEVDENEVDVPGWEEKRRYLFALEVLTDFIKLVIYIVFFTVSMTFNGLPMHIMRDVYLTFASFSKRVTDYVAYRKATSDMNSRYPDATTEEIRGDACIVCRESMVAWERPDAQAQAQPAGEQPAAVPAPARRRDEGLRAKKLPCGHILHLRCLKAWLERQQVCPTCRRPVVTAETPDNAAAGGGNAPAPGQQGQQRQAPRPRARMFNFGPLRVGLLNAPNGQMQNILNQIQNPEGQDQNLAEQQGPNHRDIQDPNANQPTGGQQGAPASNQRGGRASVPMQIQLMQLEQRIMQEAHNLGIEQQQLANLRFMEAELARLRSQHIPTQIPVGMDGMQIQQPQRYSQMQMPGFAPFPHTLPSQQQFNAQQPLMERLRGNVNEQFGANHPSLPQGMVLPEGWTVMPLHQVAGDVRVPDNTSQSFEDTHHPGTHRQADPSAGAAQTASFTPANNAPNTAQNDNATGPTDERGSPLFIPTQSPATNSPRSSGTAIEAAADHQAHRPTGAPGTTNEPQTTTPWTRENSWKFVDRPPTDAGASAAQAAKPSEGGRDAEPTNGRLPSTEQSYTGKGKGKAVEVEDVADPDA